MDVGFLYAMTNLERGSGVLRAGLHGCCPWLSRDLVRSATRRR